MTSTPYPTLTTTPSSPLHTVGRVRLHPSTICTETYNEILDGIRNQTTASTAAESKTHYKANVKRIETFFTETCRIDPTMTMIEVLIPTRDIIETEGNILTCFYDGGADICIVHGVDMERIVKEEWGSGIPPHRLMAHFDRVFSSSGSASSNADVSIRDSIAHLKKISEYASSVSLVMEEGDGVTSNGIVELMNIVKKETQAQDLEQIIVQITTNQDSLESLADMIGNVSRAIAGDWGLVTLIDPSPVQLGASYAACVRTDRTDGLFSTVVCAADGVALGLVYSSQESIIAAIASGQGVYYSRSRSSLWRKGDTSGHYQILHRIDLDCDADALRFTVTQLGQPKPAFCHLSTRTCWGTCDAGLYRLQNVLKDRLHRAPEGSYTKRLFCDDTLLKHKLVEEAMELIEADHKQHVAEELADVLYFALVKAAKFGVTIDDAVGELDKRAKKVTRRKGDSKAERIQESNSILALKEKNDGDDDFKDKKAEEAT